jgi:hypothetical protein
LLAHVVQSSPLKRQSVFAACAEIDQEGHLQALAERFQGIGLADGAYALDPLTRVARTLRTARASEIIEAVFGSVPDGLLGVMRRLGHSPFNVPQGYRALHELMANPIHRQRAKVLLQLGGPLNETTINIVR